MTVIFESGYTLPSGDYPLKNARIAHSLNWLSGGTVTASSTATDYFASGPANTLTYERWKPSSISATWEYDHGSSLECDYCCIAAHTMGTNGNTLTVQYYNGSTWVTLATEALTNDEPIMAIFEPVTAQRWRISIASGTAPEIGVIKFGSALQMPRPFYGGHEPGEFARYTVLSTNNSDTGEYLGRSVRRTYRSTSYSWEHIPRAWADINWNALQLAIEAEPFWIAWRPYDKDGVLFAMVDEVPRLQNMGVKDYMAASMTVRARGWD